MEYVPAEYSGSVRKTLLHYPVGSESMFTGRIRFIFAGFIFKIALDISYATFLTNAFEDHFLTPFPVNFDIIQYAESFIWLLIILATVPFSSRSAGGLAFFSALVFLYIPVATIFGMDDDRSRYTLFLSTLAIMSAYLVDALNFGRRVKIPIPLRGERTLLAISLLFVALFLLNATVSGALFGMNFNIDNVYEFRSEQGAKINVGLFAYTNLWAQKVFTPLIFAIGLRRKSFWLICFALAMHVIYFGVTQHRSHLFAPILVFAAFILYRSNFSYAKGFAVFSVALCSATVVILVFKLDALGALIIRRALFVGASAAYSWVEYFSENAKVFFADNLLAPFVSNQYTGVNLPRFMGDFMRADREINFNSGLVGSGFAQLGAFGVILYGGFLGMIIRVNRRLIESGVPPYIHAAILFFPFRIAWADADIFSALLSHGLIVGAFAIWLFGTSKYQSA